MVNLVKLFLVPGSIPFLVAGLALGVGLLYAGDRPRRWGRAWLTVLLLAYAFLSTPLGADFVASALVPRSTSVTRPEQAAGIDTLVVLSTGGEVYRARGEEVVEMGRPTSFNAMEAARLYRLVSPRTVIASGGIVDPLSRRLPEADALAGGLVRLGVPRERIVLESRSRTTREQAVNVAAALKKRGITRFLLVTTSDHMPRAAATFRELGLQPVPSASVVVMTNGTGILERLYPSVGALRQSGWACYEYLARTYYWSRGWL
jgi:uncharacterized SAM-binding protein YcdF (DUF218 family)